ncbi:MAG: hypothetical protein HXY22_08970 [Alphaproteobacteria bacterium]|nr:hypothetical protein [Alphaproteobacteria bacterium]
MLRIILFLALLTASGGALAASQKGERLLGLDANPSETGDVAAALSQAQRAGVDFVEVSLYWDEIEASPGRFSQRRLREIAPMLRMRNLGAALTLAVIDGPADRRPHDLRGKTLDDPLVTRRYAAALARVLREMDDVRLIALSPGHDIDLFLKNAADWQAFETLFSSFAQEARQLRPDAPIGAKATFAGATSEARAEIARVNALSDVILVSYAQGLAPGSLLTADAASDFALLSGLAPLKPIHVLDASFPSALGAGGSEGAQARFVKALFLAFDQQQGRIRALQFSSLTDLSPTAAGDLASYLGRHDEGLAAYFSSMGFRRFSGLGKDKLAMRWLINEALTRGWVPPNPEGLKR